MEPTGSPSPATMPTGPAGPVTTSRMAIWAMVLGALSFATSCVGIGLVLGIVAIVLGAVAMSRINDPAQRLTGHGMALTGTILGGVSFVLVPVFALLLGIMLPALSAARTTAQRMQNSTQVRGIHQALVTACNANNGYYPGLDSQGNIVDPSVEGRFQYLLDNVYFTGEYAISPFDPSAQEWTGGQVTSNNYSYALPSIDEVGARQDSWRDTVNAREVAISDRNIGTVGSPQSFGNDPGNWEGSIGWNDNHVGWQKSPVVETEYGGTVIPNDYLFDANGPNDALQIHSGD